VLAACLVRPVVIEESVLAPELAKYGVGKPVKSPADYMRELVAEGSSKLPPVFAVASGTKDGKPASAAAAILSAPAVGMVAFRGVFAPEGIVDRKVFFDLLAPLCSPKKSSMDDLLLISRSWENVDLRTKLRKLAEASGTD
jgi:hypothetical protein